MTTRPGTPTTLSVKYNHTSKEEWETFRRALNNHLTNHRDKLDAVVLNGQIHGIILRELKRALKADGLNNDEIDNELNNMYYPSYNKTVFTIITTNITNQNLIDQLERDYNNKGHEAFKFLDGYWSAKNDHMAIALRNERKDHIGKGMMGSDLDALRNYVDPVLTWNDKLKDGPYKMQPEEETHFILDAARELDMSVTNTYVTNKYQTTLLLGIASDWKKNSREIWKELQVLFETVGATKTAAPRQREALNTGTATEQAMLNRITALELALQEQKAQNDKLIATTIKSRKPCTHCNKTHAGTCYGNEIAEGRMTTDQAIADLRRLKPDFSADKSKSIVTSSHAAVMKVKGETNAGTTTQIPPRTRLVANTGVEVTRTSGGECISLPVDVLDDAQTRDCFATTAFGGMQIVKFDSCADIHVLNQESFFPTGTQSSDIVLTTITPAAPTSPLGSSLECASRRGRGAS